MGLSRPLGTNLRIESLRSPFGDRVSASETASPRRSSTSYASLELVRSISSVSSVSVSDSWVCCALRVETCD